MNSQSEPERSLAELVKHVFKHSSDSLEGITYQELAGRIDRLNKHGIGHGHGMGDVLGKMGHLLQDLSGEWGESIPHIQSLVIQKTGGLKGLPDDGIQVFWKGYPKLTKQEKFNKVHTEYVRIAEFGSRWNKVLSSLSLSPIQYSKQQGCSKGSKYGGGGESPEHKDLKIFLSKHPELVGVNKSGEPFVEYSFPSLDAVDVLFKNKKRWVAVEVKSRISSEKDYERGLYQCVKYHALLEAMKKDDNYKVPEDIQVVLLLEKTLPQRYKQAATELNIKVIENIKAPRKKV